MASRRWSGRRSSPGLKWARWLVVPRSWASAFRPSRTTSATRPSDSVRPTSGRRTGYWAGWSCPLRMARQQQASPTPTSPTSFRCAASAAVRTATSTSPSSPTRNASRWCRYEGRVRPGQGGGLRLPRPVLSGRVGHHRQGRHRSVQVGATLMPRSWELTQLDILKLWFDEYDTINLAQYRGQGWRPILNGLMTDFDADEDEAVLSLGTIKPHV